MGKIIRLAPTIVDCVGGDWRLCVGCGVGAAFAIWISWERHARFTDIMAAVYSHGVAVDLVLAMASAKVLLVCKSSGGAGYWLRILRI